ncbi:MAG TPA: hypothetical protein PLC39_02900 [Methanomassiliicoccales archaeon]|nr:hypothetical protein [Methanomassiliicoccales archaeon]HNX47474.1 hypothetical protein [Methanomassiliicoccales archaeon]HPR98231.1 hypothetical protein [Methanomassiliicoccales archaeon]
MSDDLVFKVAKRRLQEIQEELPHPDIATHFSIDEVGRGSIDIFYQGALIGHEIIETADSWKDEGRLIAYRDVLRKKIRLVVMAPRSEAMQVRYRMLELNNWWLFYYMVYGYDGAGRLVRVLRPHPPDRKTPETSYIS